MCTHVTKLSMELNDDISELKDIIGKVLVTITPEMRLQVMLSMRRRLHPCAQPGDQCFENLYKVANLYVWTGRDNNSQKRQPF